MRSFRDFFFNESGGGSFGYGGAVRHDTVFGLPSFNYRNLSYLNPHQGPITGYQGVGDYVQHKINAKRVNDPDYVFADVLERVARFVEIAGAAIIQQQSGSGAAMTRFNPNTRVAGMKITGLRYQEMTGGNVELKPNEIRIAQEMGVFELDPANNVWTAHVDILQQKMVELAKKLYEKEQKYQLAQHATNQVTGAASNIMGQMAQGGALRLTKGANPFQ